MINFVRVKVLTFDCYGTLIDWETGICSTFEDLHPIKTWDPDMLLNLFAAHEHKVQELHPHMLYTDVLKEVYKRMTEELFLRYDIENAERFAASVSTWPPFKDTVEALHLLSKKFKFIIISNVDLESIRKTQQQLEVPFYRVFTTQEMGFYKPDLRVFEHVLRALETEGINITDIVHVAQSLFHDHEPASRISLKRV